MGPWGSPPSTSIQEHPVRCTASTSILRAASTRMTSTMHYHSTTRADMPNSTHSRGGDDDEEDINGSVSRGGIETELIYFQSGSA